MGALRFSWVDVFTDRPFTGNPLAVVPEADGLDPDLMQTLARELALSETVFVSDGARSLRIFTPRAELPLAGHPVVGTAVELARLGAIPREGPHTFRTKAGDVAVDVRGGVATMTQLEFQLAAELGGGLAAELLGIGPGDLVGSPIVCTTTGIWQAFAQVRDRATLARVTPDLAGIAALDEADGLAAWAPEGDAVAQRFFAPKIGVAEDPATGSAAGALGALRVYRGAPPGRVKVLQGAEIGRPSTIEVTVGGTAGAPADIRVGGSATLVLEGSLAPDALLL